MKKSEYELLKTHNDSRFVREMATKFWGTETLKKRCLNPILANRGREDDPDNQRLILTPEKCKVLKACLADKLTDLKVEGRHRAKRMNAINSYLRSKLYDVQRKRKN
ncbi:uncharacterized protein LOC127281047 [Leptopilina boulardi]|uniref:uncharacterized protein LOC127281047 n=1 Tax=Leptopilina boulardi TaxID=63433 RepID=UPI0021F64A2F|nr:uncharacterized protein LOC127281047 [Leptopilina boulardi]